MNSKIKKRLDFIPLIGLVGSAIYLIWTVTHSDIVLVWKHYFAIALLISTIILFGIRHLLGVLFLGVNLTIGLIGLLSFSPSITSMTFGLGHSGGNAMTLLKFQPIFLLWLIIYFIFSGRHFVGIASKKYWAEFKSKER